MPPKPTVPEIPLREPSGRKRIPNRRYDDTSDADNTPEPATKRMKSATTGQEKEKDTQHKENVTVEDSDNEGDEMTQTSQEPDVLDLEDVDTPTGGNSNKVPNEKERSKSPIYAAIRYNKF